MAWHRKKRTFKRRARRGYRRKPVVAIGVPSNHTFPKMMKITHRYIETLGLTCTAGVAGKYQWSLNGLFDPNITGGGGQPLLFDQMTPLYQHYCVIGAKVTIKCTPTSTLNPASVVGAYIDSGTGAALSATPDLIANSQHSVVMPIGGVNTKVFTTKWSAKKFFGRSPLANDELQGTAAANPAEQSYFTLYVASLDQTSNTSMNCILDIEYIAIWKETKAITQS